MATQGYNHFPQLVKAVHQGIKDAVKQAADDIAQAAAAHAPVLTGALRDSITSQQDDDLHATVTVGVDYGVYVEFGTSRMAAQPYLTPAVEAERQKVGSVLKISISKAINSI